MDTTDKYVDLLLTNSIQTHSNHRVALNFSQNQSQPVLKSTNGYQLSIIRFSLNTETLPIIFIPAMQSTTTTIYSFTMESNGKQFQQFMQFEPQNLNPVDPDEHYYVYNYQYVIYLMSKCLASCLAGLSALTICTTSVPTLTFDPTSQKCTLNIDNTTYGYNESNKINIYLNSSMYALLASLLYREQEPAWHGLSTKYSYTSIAFGSYTRLFNCITLEPCFLNYFHNKLDTYLPASNPSL